MNGGKQLTIAGGLLLLAAMIGHEFFSPTGRARWHVSRSKAADSRPPGRGYARADGGTTAVSGEAIPAAGLPTNGATRAADAPTRNAAGIFHKDAFAMPAGPPDSICFVRSHAILESTQLDRDSVERLRAAVAIVSAAAGAPCVVVDRDGLATSQSPFVLYANPSCDLTVAVQAAYLNLQAGGNGIEELGKADQATPPQPP